MMHFFFAFWIANTIFNQYNKKIAIFGFWKGAIQIIRDTLGGGGVATVSPNNTGA